MSPEVRLAPGGRPQRMYTERPLPVVRLEIASAALTHTDRRDTAAARSARPAEREEDDLRPARGILFSTLLGVGLWVVLLYLFWIIAN